MLQRSQHLEQRQRREQNQRQARNQVEIEPRGQVCQETNLLATPQLAAEENVTPVQLEDLRIAERPTPPLLLQALQVVRHDSIADGFMDVNALESVQRKPKAEVG